MLQAFKEQEDLSSANIPNPHILTAPAPSRRAFK
jgi:hypothetical protein